MADKKKADKEKLKEIMDAAKQAKELGDQAAADAKALEESIAGQTGQALPTPALAQVPAQMPVPAMPQAVPAQAPIPVPNQEVEGVNALNSDVVFRNEILIRLDMLIAAVIKAGEA